MRSFLARSSSSVSFVLGGRRTFMYFAAMIGLILLGVWVLYGQRDLIRQAVASYKWRATDGSIMDSADDTFTAPGIDSTGTGVVPVSYQETTHVYEYQVEGRTYQSSTYCFGAHVERAEAVVLIGRKVRV